MVKYKDIQLSTTGSELALRLQAMHSPEMTKALEELYSRYGKYAVPVAELRKRLDKELGKRTLTEELYAMREGR